MASYTMPLRAIIEQATQYEDDLSRHERIEIGRQKLFDFDYPIFDQDFKSQFETNFIRHFYMREIGFETEELFKFHLETWLNINMPYFNTLFESTMIEYDPLKNAEMDVEHLKKSDRTQSSKTDGTSTGQSNEKQTGEAVDDNFARQIESDNPDTRLRLTANDGQGVIEYAGNIQENKENNKRNTKGNTDTETESTTSLKSDAAQQDIEDYVQRRIGKVGVKSYPKMIQEYRDAIIRVEQMAFDEMNVLFMLVY